ncbi:DUF58 domain-containing protein [Rathayibacter sp. YIM 133350]|uniref:DUF58 domain-containing protein n=1 Tax=Rathayibacter sp. YIM 133350 TaxID=3131992 RepID=UPI00307D198B
MTQTSAEATALDRLDVPREGALAVAIEQLVRASGAVGRSLRAAGRFVGGTVTAFGWCIVASVVVGFAVGYWLGWSEFVAIGWGALVLLCISALYLVGRDTYRIRLSLPLDRVVAGERAPGEVILENPRRRRLGSLWVEVPVGEGLAEFHVAGVASGQSESEVFLVPTERRGVISVGPVRTIRGDPVGLLRRELTWSDRVELFVHPRTAAIPSLSTGILRDLEGAPTRDITDSDVSFHALREYMPGDDRRFIHWRSSAKTGTYMVRQFEQTRRSHILVALSTQAADYASEEEFELAVSAAGSLGVYAIRDGRTVSVVVGERTRTRMPRLRELRTDSRTRLLDDLTVVSRDAAAARLVDVARSIGRRTSGASVAFLLCGSMTPIAALRQAAAALPPGVEVIAVLCEPGVVPALKRIAELTVVSIGFLDDLQKSLARTAAL